MASLQASIQSLETRLDALSTWLHIFVFLAVIGVAAEVLLVILEYAEKHRAHERGTIRSPARPHLGHDLLLPLSCAILVTVGVGGEFAVGNLSESVAADLRRLNGEYIALLNREAELARLSAAKAVERSEELRIQAEEERLARVKIERRLAPRTLTAAEHARLVAVLKTLGRQDVDIFLYPNDPEITSLAEHVAGALYLAGWTFAWFQPLSGGRVSGMSIEVDPKDPAAVKRANGLAAALKSVGMEVSGPLATLPTPPTTMPPYTFGGRNVGASIRLTVGKK
ncbi:MAG: hypothetical protein JSU00_22370 [Acidobacteria bacterium]|nr:hypothetical protein [Acidobacteriota bacterium]